MNFWEAAASLPAQSIALLVFALFVALAFECINGFHDTANAVTTVIYTRSLPATPAVLYSGFVNFLGVILGGTAVAFGIVNLLPVDALESTGESNASLVMVISILIAAVVWNFATWYLGIPVSSSHTLIGSILGVGVASSLMAGNGLSKGVDWAQATKVGMSLLLSPALGFLGAAALLLALKAVVRSPRLYTPPVGDDRPPWWIRLVLIGTCGLVSFGHGSNDGQKGMGLILLVLIGFLPAHFALDVYGDKEGPPALKAAQTIRAELTADGRKVSDKLAGDFDRIDQTLAGVTEVGEVPEADRYALRKSLTAVNKAAGSADLPEDVRKRLAKKDEQTNKSPRDVIKGVLEFVPLWVVISVALALGIGTTVGYKRIVLTVAEKIGKTHLSYAQGAVAELVTAAAIQLADRLALPVSTTQLLSSSVAGTMVANKSGVQGNTVRRILLAWVLTLPAAGGIGGLLYVIGRQIAG